MGSSDRHGDIPLTLPILRQVAQPTVAEQVFNILKERILTLELAPRTKISEAEVASLMGVSRQPVREAFKRLAQIGLLLIRPQSSTTVSLISEEAVLRARYIRVALEIQTCRTACEKLTDDGFAALARLIEKQKAAVAADDRLRFHALDDQFHKEICTRSGVGFVWDLIHENKAHMDRVRMLSLDSPSQQHALDEHIMILDAISARDADAASAAIIQHLSRILVFIGQIKAERHSWFTDEAT